MSRKQREGIARNKFFDVCAPLCFSLRVSLLEKRFGEEVCEEDFAFYSSARVGRNGPKTLCLRITVIIIVISSFFSVFWNKFP